MQEGCCDRWYDNMACNCEKKEFTKYTIPNYGRHPDKEVMVYRLQQANESNNYVDFNYLNLVDDVLTNSQLKPTRAKIDGKNISAYSVFGRQARFSLSDEFPILTTKKINFNAIVHELIWFLSGSSNIKYLRDNNVHIWDQWCSPYGELGYGTYGSLWRSFPFHVYDDEMEKWYGKNWLNCEEGDFWGQRKIDGIKFVYYETDVVGKVDQIRQLIDNIKKVKENPTESVGRRLIVTAWHPYYVDKVGLPPCHCLFQFNVTGDKLSCHLFQRSCDLFLGVPFNISSYSLLTCIIAKLTGLVPHEFIHTYSDLHIYENHIDQLKEQLARSPYKLPKLVLSDELNDIDNIKREYITLEGYQSWPTIRGEVAV